MSNSGYPPPPAWQPNPYGSAPNPYGSPYAAPPPRSPQSKWLWLGLGGGGLIMALLCCGMCGGAAAWGVRITEDEIADELRKNPKLVEHVGEIETVRHDWSAFLSDDSDAEHDVFTVKGAKGSARVIVGHSSDFGETEQVHSAVLVLPNGERVDLMPEGSIKLEAE